MEIQNNTKKESHKGLQELQEINNSSKVEKENRKFSTTTISYTAGILTAIAGLIVMAGWLFDNYTLETFGFGGVTMKANTALSFIFSGFALILLQQEHRRFYILLARIFSAITALLGFAVLYQYVAGVNLGIDEFLFHEVKNAIGTSNPNRMAPYTSLNFFLLGLILFIYSFPKIQRNFVQVFLLVVAFTISATGLTGYILGFDELYGLASFTKMAVNTSALFIILCTGLYFSMFNRKKQPTTLEYKLLAGLTFVSVLIIFVSVTSVSSIQALKVSSDRVEHSQQVKEKLEQIGSEVNEFVASDRGYIISNNKEFLVTWDQSKKNILHGYTELNNLVKENPNQHEALINLYKLIEERIKFSELLVETYNTIGSEAAFQLLSTLKGQRISDEINLIDAQIKEEENKHYQEQSEIEKQHAANTVFIIFINLVLQLIFLTLIFLSVKKDVSGRRKAEKELLLLNEGLNERVKEKTAAIIESEKRYRLTLDNMMEGCQIIGHDWKYKYINKEAEKHNQRPNEELIDKRYTDMWPGIESTEVYKKIKHCMEEKVNHRMENKFLFPDGTPGWFQLGIQSLPEGVLILSNDITEVKLAEIKAKNANDRFKNLVNSLHDVVWTASIDGRVIVDVNSSFEKIYGISLDEFKANPKLWIEMVHPDDKHIAEASGKDLIEKGTAQVEYRIVKPDGIIVWLLDRKSLIYDESGKAVQMGGIAKDITERKNAENKFIRNNALLELIAKNTPLPEILESIVKEIEHEEHASTCSILLLDDDGKKLLLGAAPNFPDFYNKAVHGFPIGKGMGSCGEAAFTKQRVIAEDLLTHPNWLPFADIVKKTSFKSCWSEPILDSKGEVLGTFAIYHSKPQMPNLEDLERIQSASAISSIAIEGKRADEKLEKAEKRFRSLIELGNDIITLTDKNGRIKYVSPSNQTILAFTEEEYLGTNAFSYVHADDREELQKRFLTAFNSPNKNILVEFRHRHKDGSYRWLQSFGMNRLDDPRLEAIVASSRDITERKAAEESLREKEERFRKTLDLGVVGVATTHPYNYRFLSANKHLCDMLGYTEEELLQKTWAEITFPKVKVEEDATNLENLLSGKLSGYIMEKQYQHKDGHLIDITLSVQGVRKKDGTIDYVLILVDDITERKIAERKILQQTTDLQLLNSINLAINRGDSLDTIIEVLSKEIMQIFNCFGTIACLPSADNKFLIPKSFQFPSPKATKLFEMAGGSFSSLPLKINLTPNTRIAKVMALGKPKAFNNADEIKAVMAEFTDNRVLKNLAPAVFNLLEFRSMILIPLVAGNEIYGMLEIARSEITSDEELKRLEVIAGQLTLAIGHKLANEKINEINASLEIKVEERTEQLEMAKLEAEEANHAKSEFLSRMSHELRTPMNSILGFAQLMSMGELDQKQKKGVSRIMQSGKHLLDLINEVLDLSRIEAGKLTLSLEPILLSALVAESLDIVQSLADAKAIKLIHENESSEELFAKADRQKLKQVLLNLINNAVKYNRDAGTVKVSYERKQDKIRISIADTGIGIAEHDLPKLFNPFQRIGHEISEIEGTGLGLTVAKKLTEAMNGIMGVESEKGVGSTFWIEFPRADSQAASYKQSHEIKSVIKTPSEVAGTLLYIEDNVSNIELVEQILTEFRREIRLISEMYGKKALQLANEYKPDLILLDLDLPDIHGSEVLKLLQQDKNTKSIPVVVLSADAMSHQIDKLLKSGAKNYLTKPIDVKEFLSVVDGMLKKKS
jgi:PAS domain S-box-containing protein